MHLATAGLLTTYDQLQRHFLEGMMTIGFAMVCAIILFLLTGGSMRETVMFYAIAFMIMILVAAFIVAFAL